MSRHRSISAHGESNHLKRLGAVKGKQMNKKDLIDLGIAEDVAEKIVILHGKDIESHKSKLATLQSEIDGAKAQLADANTAIEGFKKLDVDGIQKAADEYKAKFEQQSINNELLAAASDALDADVIMALLGNKAVVDATGKVTVEGKTAKEAVADLLKAKPHLAKASGAAGSGAPNSTTQPPPSSETAYADAYKARDVRGMLLLPH